MQKPCKTPVFTVSESAFVCSAGFSPEFLHLCIINNLGGLANNGCGQLHVHCFACCNAEKKNKTKVSQKPADFIW